jgi:two-component system chemotaxis response regulator CheY
MKDRRREGYAMANVMIVDDSIFMQSFIGDMIEKLGHKVIGTAQNGEEAIEQYVRLMPDLVFMDVTMEKMSGVGAVKEIIRLDKDARIVMCSAMGQEIIIKEAIQEGAKNFIVKPFQSDDIKTSIEKYAKK